MIDVKYGILKELHLSDKFGVRAVLTNVTIKLPDGETEDDAALILMRRSFGVGRSHIIRRQHAHELRDTPTLLTVAIDATTRLFGSADKDNTFRICDLLQDHLEELVMHPPEDQMIEIKRREKEIEQSGILVKLNDEVILDAR